ncbi:unnamed protein product [Sympodiomycopsis kandeliae]
MKSNEFHLVHTGVTRAEVETRLGANPGFQSKAKMSSSSRVTLERYAEVETAWKQLKDERVGMDERIARERQEADKVHEAFQDLLRDYETVCTEKDTLKSQLDSTQLKGSSAELDALKAENAKLQAELQEATSQNVSLNQKYEEDREHWRQFRAWWDQALAAKKERKSSAKKPKLNSHERVLLDKVGLDTPDRPKQAQNPIDQNKSHTTPAPIRHTTAAEEPVTPQTRLPVSLLSADPARVHDWLSKVDQRPPVSSEASSDDRSASDKVPAPKADQDSATRPPEKPAQADKSQPCRSERTHSPDSHTTPSSKRRRLSDHDVCPTKGQSPTGASRSPLREISENRSPELNEQGDGEDAISLPREPRSRPSARITTSKRHTSIKAESDDENAHDCALVRTQQSQEPAEMSREDILKKRKAEMEDLKKNPWKYRGRGRYAAELQRRTGITGQYEISAALNGGVTYEHNDVVRDKNRRRQMHAYDCPCCKDYWDAVGHSTTAVSPTPPLASRPARNMTRTGSDCNHSTSPRTGAITIDGSDDEEEESYPNDTRWTSRRAHEQRRKEQQEQAARQKSGRHRAWGRPAATPEGYWEIGFPDTPRKEEINDSAKRQRLQKLKQVANDPRYRRKEAAR